jgi:hypothetical protein
MSDANSLVPPNQDFYFWSHDLSTRSHRTNLRAYPEIV